MSVCAEIGFVVVAVVAFGTLGCGSARRGPLAGAPVTPDTVAEKRGERLFFKHCSRCHPGGEAGLGPALNNKPLPELAIETQIRQGIGAMPAFSEDQLSEQQVEAIAEFVVEMRETERRGPEKNDAPERRRDSQSQGTSASR